MLRSKGGSVAIATVLLFTGLISILYTFIYFSQKNSALSAGRSLGTLWCSSVLAEYDLHLLEDYNLFAFYGMSEHVSDRIDFYARESCKGKKYISYDGSNCNMSSYSLSDIGNVKDQMVVVGRLLELKKIAGVKSVKLDGDKKDVDRSDDDKNGQNIEGLFDELPSEGAGNGLPVKTIASMVGSGSIKDLIKKGTDQKFLITYQNEYFQNMLSQVPGKRYFSNEQEYIICGKKLDSKNRRAVKLRIIALREVPNLKYLHSSPVREAEARAVALAIAPEAAEPVYRMIMATWATAEAVNDYRILKEGGRIEFFKDDDSWAVSLNSIFKGGMENYRGKKKPEFKKNIEFVDKSSKGGSDYQEYINLLTLTVEEDTRVARMMDLVQINMQYGYYPDFRLLDFSTGLDAQLEINGNKVDISREYQVE